MAKRAERNKTAFVCRECGSSFSKWLGQCTACNAWNSLDEERLAAPSTGGRAPAVAPRVVDAASLDLKPEQRVRVGIAELDRVLGGGLVHGSVVLIGGDPGIGKSTLLMQTVAHLNASSARTLYVSGEESLTQIAMRARRLGATLDGLRLLADTALENVLAALHDEAPDIVVIDSIQTMASGELQSVPGSVSQVRECAARLTQYAKQAGCAVFLVGHVTKEGALAGPRVLEHMVDAVLYFENADDQRYRVIRAVKNRFGTVNELGIFAMTDSGLSEVRNPSAIFLARQAEQVPGSVVTVTREGTRPLLVELQALLDETQTASPRRLSVGLDGNRLLMLLAALHRHVGIGAHGQDVFLNVVGGVRLSETAADLPTLLAVVSSLRNRPLPRDLVAFGEVGLGGEIRPVPNGEERVQAAVKHGFTTLVIPAGNRIPRPPAGATLRPVHGLAEALEVLQH